MIDLKVAFKNLLYSVSFGHQESIDTLREMMVTSLKDCPPIVLIEHANVFKRHVEEVNDKSVLLLSFNRNGDKPYFTGNKMLIAGCGEHPETSKFLVVDRVPKDFWYKQLKNEASNV